jgi:hypothetical protein
VEAMTMKTRLDDIIVCGIFVASLAVTLISVCAYGDEDPFLYSPDPYAVFTPDHDGSIWLDYDSVIFLGPRYEQIELWFHGTPCDAMLSCEAWVADMIGKYCQVIPYPRSTTEMGRE